MSIAAPEAVAGALAAREVLALVNAQATARDRLTAVTRAYVSNLYRGFTGWYDRDSVARVAGRAAKQVRSGQQASADVSAAYMRAVLDLYGVRGSDRRRVVIPKTGLRTADPLDVWGRPAEEFRFARSIDLDPETAIARAVARAERMAEDDLNLGAREGSRQAIADVPEVSGFRRVIHPELSRGGTCGLCIAASDRIYNKAELLPLHSICRCETLPIVGDNDPGAFQNDYTLDGIYADAGGNTRDKLKRTRYRIQDHGELGPTLALVKGQAVESTGETVPDELEPPA